MNFHTNGDILGVSQLFISKYRRNNQIKLSTCHFDVIHANSLRQKYLFQIEL